jgi:hypothetical protein
MKYCHTSSKTTGEIIMNTYMQSEIKAFYETKLLTEDPKKMTYDRLQAQHSKEVNNFPLLFAFGQKQFDKMKSEHGVENKDLFSIGGGGYIRKTDRQAYHDLFLKHDKERTEAMQEDSYLFSMFYSELANHEYCYTYDNEPTLEACYLEEKNLTPNQAKQFQLAKDKYNSEGWQ